MSSDSAPGGVPEVASGSASASPRAPSLAALLAITFSSSVSGGAFGGGLYFVSAGPYGFSAARNLALGTLMGAMAAGGAISSAHFVRKRPARTVLLLALAAWSAAAFLPVAFPASEPLLWLGALFGGAASGVVWPIVESFVSAGRHGGHMRAAIGLFNMSWTPAVAIPLFLMPLLSRLGDTASLGLAGLVTLVSFGLALTLPPSPGAHATEAAEAAMGAEYPRLAETASWLLPLGYVLSSLLSPLLPFRLRALGLGANASVVAALWMAARFATFAVMWRSHFWHGRWGTLASGSLALVLGLTAVLLGGSLRWVIPGLVVFGTGMGLVYYAALYYSLTVGRAEVDAGGKFEALVGLGSALGPLLGMAGAALATTLGAAASEPTTVLLAALIVLGALPGAWRPYWRARQSRRR